MPELAEVETIKRGIICLEKQTIIGAVIRNPKLRYRVDPHLDLLLKNLVVNKIKRRAKYLVFDLTTKNKNLYLLVHLGMSGSLTLTDTNSEELRKHDHVDILFASGAILRYNDPRRFGCIVWTDNLDNNPLLCHLGYEPLNSEFDATYFFAKLTNKSSSIKQLIMDNTIVVGVGNIYACESLFLAKISPLRVGVTISKDEAITLVKCIKQVLRQAIKLGGSSITNYKHADGTLGYFQNRHNVYGRGGKECNICNELIQEQRLGQRNSFYCRQCQH